MATKPKEAKDGPPRWTYVAGSVVAIGGLAWGIVSYFIPKPELPKAPAAPAVAQEAKANGGNAVNAAGNANVVIGDQPSPPTAASSALFSAPVAASQSAAAASGGVAVNATDSARVKVTKQP